jgi:hypothetical protein
MATHEIAAGKDPRRSLEEGARQVEERKKRDGGTGYAGVEVGDLSYATALYAFHQSEDPEPSLRDAREAFGAIRRRRPGMSTR